MTPAARERSQVRAPVLFVSAAAWTLLVLEPGSMGMHAHHTTMQHASLDMMLASNPPSSLALGWALMLAAMMAPLLIAPVRHVRDRSFARRRARSIGLSVAGYAAIWMAAGVLLMSLAMAVRLYSPESFMPLGIAAIVALVWQISPLKQRCLNRGHAHPQLAAFGWAADIGAFRFGLTHGVWCAGSCWTFMLLPLLVTPWHMAAMAAVTLWLAAERLEPPAFPRWGLRVPLKAVRIAVAQARFRLPIS
jgi:predicted metal-binding membrane protein